MLCVLCKVYYLKLVSAKGIYHIGIILINTIPSTIKILNLEITSSTPRKSAQVINFNCYKNLYIRMAMIPNIITFCSHTK